VKTIGLIGGISWQSTAIYYRLLNELAHDALGGSHAAELLLWSFDFAEIEALQEANDWPAATGKMVDAARLLQAGGAQCIVICANTMHRMAGEVAAAVNIPLIHIADATATVIKKSGARRPLLLATRYTMEQDFYTGRLRDRHGIDVRVPRDDDRKTVHDIIYGELCRGLVRPESKAKYLGVVERSPASGIDGIIFGCTEVGMLLSQDDFDVPVFDTAVIHARAAMQFALGNA
jgi:aspartate racemase